MVEQEKEAEMKEHIVLYFYIAYCTNIIEMED